MNIKINEARELCMEVLIKKGMPEADASVVVDEYLDGELRGRECHGLSSFKKFAVKNYVASDRPKILKDESGYFHIDGNNVKAHIVLRENLPKLIEKAKKQGIAMLGMFNSASYLMPGTYARQIAENNLVGIIMNYGGYPRICPTGSIDPVFGTNPIAMGFPSDDLPIVIDMGTSEMVMGKVRLADKLGRDLPQGVAIDKDGNATIDPKEAMDGALFPFGGHKGYCMALAIELLTKVMFNIEKKNRGYLFLCIDPSVYNDNFRSQVSELIENIKSTRKAPGVKEIFLPGERSERLKQENLKKGSIEVDDIIIGEIKGLL